MYNITQKPAIGKLIAEISSIPSDWVLTPVNGNKAPYRKGWQNESAISRDILLDEISKGRAKGYGLRTGQISGGIVAIDADGKKAHDLAKSLGGLPTTVSFTSGKEGRAQYLYFIPNTYWEKITTKKLPTGHKSSDGKEELLELRWDGCQSVLPPSKHPETREYKWLKSPNETDITQAPTWVIEKMLKETPKSLPLVGLSDSVPLEKCLTKDDRQLLQTGASQGSRNDSAAKLARNLIGTYNWLNSNGEMCQDDPRALFDNFCDRCNPPLPPRERGIIWKSAEKSNPTPTLSDDFLINCAKSYRKQPTHTPTHWTEKDAKNTVVKCDLQILKDIEKIKRAFGGKIRYNTRLKVIEIDGEPINPDAPEIDLAKKGGIEIKGSLRIKNQIILDVAQGNSFDPFEDYLEDCHKKWDGQNRVNGAAKRYFGTDNPLHQRYLECLLVGTVARTKKPGCKFDTLLILHGQQGIGKSTWFRTMVGDDFFCDDMGDFKEKDERLKMHQSVWTEWAEVENNISRSTSGKIKAFITTQTDNIRPPYAQRSTAYPRANVLVGSTNRTDFNHDETGARRFMVIPVSQVIPTILVEDERDQLWGEVVELYRQGYCFYLTREEQQQANLLNEEFTEYSYLHELIEEFVANKNTVTTQEIKDHLSKLDGGDMKTNDFNRISREIKKVMTTLGFSQKRFNRNGTKRMGYIRNHPVQETDTQTGSGQAADRVSVHPETPTQQLIQTERTGRTPRQENFVKNDLNTVNDVVGPVKNGTLGPDSDSQSDGRGFDVGEIPDTFYCETTEECQVALRRIFKDLHKNKKYQIGKNKLIAKFANTELAESTITSFIESWLLQENNGFVSIISPTTRNTWFSEGKTVVINKKDDPLDSRYAEITRVVSKNTIQVMVGDKPGLY
ncbi:MAG: bifunctional DNA primase/polymerase, partial [Arthrospira sp. SH-MAG29]